MIKKTMLIAIGIAGMFLGTPLADAQAGVGVNIRLGEQRHRHHYYYRNGHRRNYYYRNGHRRYYRHSGLSTSTAAMKLV